MYLRLTTNPVDVVRALSSTESVCAASLSIVYMFFIRIENNNINTTTTISWCPQLIVPFPTLLLHSVKFRFICWQDFLCTSFKFIIVFLKWFHTSMKSAYFVSHHTWPGIFDAPMDLDFSIVFRNMIYVSCTHVNIVFRVILHKLF